MYIMTKKRRHRIKKHNKTKKQLKLRRNKLRKLRKLRKRRQRRRRSFRKKGGRRFNLRFKTLKGGVLSTEDRKRLEAARHNVTPAQREALKKKLTEVLQNLPPGVIRARERLLQEVEKKHRIPPSGQDPQQKLVRQQQAASVAKQQQPAAVAK